MAIYQQSQEMETSEVNQLLEGRTTYAMEKAGHRIYYIVPQEETQNAKGGFRVFRIGLHRPADPPISTRCVLLLGETGAGKTTFINAVLNYLFGVKFDDPFRLQIEEKIGDGRLETDSRTDIITVYTVYYQEGMKHEYNFVFIDTPGLADTRGEQQQQVIMHHLEALFTLDFGVDDLHCLGVVAKGNTNRRLKYQKDLLGAIHSLLGSCVPDITHVFATHALEKVSVDAVVRDSGIPFQRMFKFDNGILLDPKETDEPWDPCKRWKKMTEQYEEFFGDLCSKSCVSISIEILKERKLYDKCMTNLREQIENLADLMVEYNKTVTNYTENKAIEEENREWKTTECEKISNELEQGKHAHNCNKCKQTCSTCTNKICKVFSSLSGNTAVTGANVGSVASIAAVPAARAVTGVLATSVAAGAAVTSAITGGIGLAVGLGTIGAVKLGTTIRGKKQCKANGCEHPLSEHSLEMIEYITEDKAITDEDMKKKYTDAKENKEKARDKCLIEQQKIMSVKNTLADNAVKFLYHEKRIKELTSQDFDYTEDITCILNGIQLRDDNYGIQAKKYVDILKEARKELHSCTAEHIHNNHECAKNTLLSKLTKTDHMEAMQLQATSK